MALKATKTVGANPAQGAAPQAAPQAPKAEQAAPQQASVPAVAPQATAVGTPVKPNELAQMNAGVLEGIDDLGVGGNYVTVDGTQFLYKSSNTLVDYIDIVVSYGKRFYQWVDESGENKVFHNSDTKLDDRYKLKFEIRWFEQGEDDEEPTEYIQTLSTTSAMNFIDYIKKLAQAGYGVGQVITRMTVSRQTSKDGKNRYSRVEFEAFSMDGQPLNIKTSEAKQF